jgi:uncharacterized membrane protein
MNAVKERDVAVAGAGPIEPAPIELRYPQTMIERIRESAALDGAGRLLKRTAERFHLQQLSERGEEMLGHPVHPALTDLPIGFWTSSCLLDVLGGHRYAQASRTLVGFGVLSAVPTVAFGMGDAVKLEPEPRRIAAVHAAANLLAVAVYTASWRRRRHQHQASGILLGFLAGAIASAGGYLGGALAWAGGDDD